MLNSSKLFFILDHKKFHGQGTRKGAKRHGAQGFLWADSDHFLGVSARQAGQVIQRLTGDIKCILTIIQCPNEVSIWADDGERLWLVRHAFSRDWKFPHATKIARQPS